MAYWAKYLSQAHISKIHVKGHTWQQVCVISELLQYSGWWRQGNPWLIMVLLARHTQGSMKSTEGLSQTRRWADMDTQSCLVIATWLLWPLLTCIHIDNYLHKTNDTINLECAFKISGIFFIRNIHFQGWRDDSTFNSLTEDPGLILSTHSPL